MATPVNAPMAGKLVSIDVKVGDSVKKNDPLATLEAMKMFIKVFSPVDGKVATIDGQADTNVDPNTVLMTIE